MNIKELVTGDQRVRFTHYKEQNLWYEHDNGFAFPVPISDCGEATFLNEDRAMLFMRYMRKHLELINQ